MPQKDIYELLYEFLDLHSGIVEPRNTGTTDKDRGSLLFQVVYKGNITFFVKYWKNGGMYLIKKNGQQVSTRFNYNKINDKTLSIMQNLINEIENGKYDTKKTQSDKIQDVVNQRQLTSYMNNTKWKELIAEIKQIDDLSIMYKTLFDENDPEFYWTIASDEHFDHMNMALVEWFKISGNINECEYIGRLVEPKVIQHSINDKIVDILQKHSINYEYDEISDSYTIYGYR